MFVDWRAYKREMSPFAVAAPGPSGDTRNSPPQWTRPSRPPPCVALPTPPHPLRPLRILNSPQSPSRSSRVAMFHIWPTHPNLRRPAPQLAAAVVTLHTYALASYLCAARSISQCAFIYCRVELRRPRATCRMLTRRPAAAQRFLQTPHSASPVVYPRARSIPSEIPIWAALV